MYRFFPNRKANKESRYHILAEKRTCTGQHRQNLLNKCPNMKKEHLSSLGPFFFLFLLPFFTCTVQPTCSRIKCMVLISCVHGIYFINRFKLGLLPEPTQQCHTSTKKPTFSSAIFRQR